MSLLQAAGLAKEFGARRLFAGVALTLDTGHRVGLIGPNGGGKTTLLRLLAGQEEPDAGTVSRARGTRIGYLAQDAGGGWGAEGGAAGSPTLLAAVAESRRLDELQHRVRELESALERGEDALAAYGDARQAFETAGGYEREPRAAAILAGLGFPAAALERPLAVLSGGERVRAALARLLLNEPDLLLLDEPTNHLDLESVAWLEDRLARWRGSLLVVSHDRYLLDRIATDILALEDGRLEHCAGNYSAYVRQREERIARAVAERRREAGERERLTTFVQRFGAGTRAAQAASRAHRLERLAEPPPLPSEWRAPHVRFRPRGASGRAVLAVDGLAKAFGDRALFEGFSAEVGRGERVAILGPNGAGKTTLLRVLAGHEPPTAGEVWWGPGCEVALLRQDLGGLPEDETVLGTILARSDLGPGEARDLLARFLFRGDAVLRRVGELSGGERNRLSLCVLVMSRANVLLLDEPTNHLDIPGREALEAALGGFTGTIMFISHDRYLVDRLATRVWALAGGRVHDLQGGFEAYRSWLAGTGESATAESAPAGRTAAAAARAGVDRGRSRREPAPPARDFAAEIEALEAELAVLETRLGEPELYRSGDAVGTVRGYHAARERLEELYREWENSLAGG